MLGQYIHEFSSELDSNSINLSKNMYEDGV